VGHPQQRHRGEGLSHMYASHVTRMNTSCFRCSNAAVGSPWGPTATPLWGPRGVPTGYVASRSKSWHTYAVSLVTHVSESRHTYERVMFLMRQRRCGVPTGYVATRSQSWHTCTVSHITHMNESCRRCSSAALGPEGGCVGR